MLQPKKDIRYTWFKTLKAAKLLQFPIYCGRHTFASRLSAAGIPDNWALLSRHSAGVFQSDR